MSRLKFVYILNSDGSDYYPEQMLVSMHSLRMYNDGAHIVLLLDQDTKDYLEGRKDPILAVADDVKVVDVPKNYNGIQRNRFIKTNMRDIVDGDFLYLDNDTIIQGDLYDLEELECDVAIAPFQEKGDWDENHQHHHLDHYNSIVKKYPKGYNHGVAWPSNNCVILTKDTERAKELYHKWYEVWKESSEKYKYHKDQCPLWIANKQLGNIMTKLDGKYDCQGISDELVFNYLFDCRIFHYFSSSYYLDYLWIMQPEWLEKIRKEGVTSEIEALIRNIKTDYMKGYAFKPYLRPKPELEVLYEKSTAVSIGQKIARDFPRVDKFLAKFFKMLG